MKVVYQTWEYFCLGCGREAKGWAAKVPVDRDERKCGPIKCGKCGGHQFEARKAA